MKFSLRNGRRSLFLPGVTIFVSFPFFVVRLLRMMTSFLFYLFVYRRTAWTGHLDPISFFLNPFLLTSFSSASSPAPSVFTHSCSPSLGRKIPYWTHLPWLCFCFCAVLQISRKRCRHWRRTRAYNRPLLPTPL